MPPDPTEPAPAVAVKNEPTANPAVDVIPVIVALHGLNVDATIEPTVPVEETMDAVGLNVYPVSNKIFLAICYPPRTISNALNGYVVVVEVIVGPAINLASNCEPAGTASGNTIYPSLSTRTPF